MNVQQKPQPTKFAVVRYWERVWAVPAIHGQLRRLEQVHRELGRRFKLGDRLAYLGNYLGHGEVRATVDLLLDFRRWLIAWPGVFASDVVFLRGAQEEMWDKLLQLQFAQNAAEVLDWMARHGIGATLEAYGGTVDQGFLHAKDGPLALTRWTGRLRATMQATPGHASLMSALRRAAYTDDRELLFVHAGLDADRPLDQQTDSLWWGSPSFAALDGSFENFGRVVRGFDPQHRGIEVRDFTTSIDSGCGFGGPLNAVCFDRSGEVVDIISA